MNLTVRFAWLVAGIIMLASPAVAQTYPETTGAPLVQPVGLTVGDRQDPQDETDQVLAKTLDDHNKRLKAIEELASQILKDQEEQTYADRFEAIEGDVTKNMEKVGDVKASLSNYVKSGHGDMTMKLSGRVHTDYWAFPFADPGIDTLEGMVPQARFGFRRLRFGVSGKINDNMGYKIESEFAGGNDYEFRDAYLSFEDLPVLRTLIIGNQKRPYGLDHLNSSRYNVFLERPFVIEANNQDARRLGIASYGFSRDERFNWRYGVYNQENVQSLGNYVGNDYQLEVTGRLASTWWWDEASDGRGYGHVGFSGSWGWPDGLDPNNQSRYRTRPEARSTNRWIDTGRIAGAESFLLGGIEGVLNVGPTQLVGEYQIVDVDRLAAFGAHTVFHGGYVYASYFLTGEHMPWDRESGTLGRVKPFENFFAVCDCEGYRQRGLGAWQVAARFSHADYNDEDINGGRGNALTLGLNWYWNPYARMQFNYLVGEIDRQQTEVAGGDYRIYGLRLMVDF